MFIYVSAYGASEKFTNFLNFITQLAGFCAYVPGGQLRKLARPAQKLPVPGGRAGSNSNTVMNTHSYNIKINMPFSRDLQLLTP